MFIFWRKSIATSKKMLYNKNNGNGSILKQEAFFQWRRGENIMKHIKTLNKGKLTATLKNGGCGKCQASCQSACKTSCTVGNQLCENEKNK